MKELNEGILKNTSLSENEVGLLQDSYKQRNKITNLEIENEKLKEANEILQKQLNDANKKRLVVKEKAKFLRSVMIAEAALMIVTVGVPNVQKTIQRTKGTNAIVSELEQANIIPKDFEIIEDEIKEQIGFSYTDKSGEKVENWNTSLEAFCSDIHNDALNDGYTSGHVAVALDNAGCSERFIEEITKCNKDQIKAEQFKAFYEMKIEEKGRH